MIDHNAANIELQKAEGQLDQPPSSGACEEFSEFIPLPNPPTAKFVENAFNSLLHSMMKRLNGFVAEGNPATVTGTAIVVRSTPQGFRMISQMQVVRAGAGSAQEAMPVEVA